MDHRSQRRPERLPSRRRAWLTCGAVSWVALLAGCGGTSTDRTTPSEESTDAPAPLPRGWHRIVDARSGFSLALPPGWTSQRGRTDTRARSRNGAAALSVFADRSRDGQDDAPVEYLRRTLGDLQGYRGLRAGAPQPLPGLRYPAATVTASGVLARTGVRQRIQLYALRRPGRVTYTISAFRNTSATASGRAAPLGRIVRSLRARPPQF